MTKIRVNPACAVLLIGNFEKRGGESPARWHKKTAMVWLDSSSSR